jgi:hypothetical protein
MTTGDIQGGNEHTAQVPPAAGSMPGRWEWVQQNWVPVVLIAVVIVPLYLTVLAVFIRSGLWRFWDASFNDEQFKALFAFLGVALGMLATLIAAMFTRSSSLRAQALLADSNRQAAQQAEESNDRQRLDTAIQVLSLIKNEQKYAGKAVTGAGITTLVVLGYPVIAMRTLEAALREEAVDMASATWVIDQVLLDDDRGGTKRLHEPMPSREEALGLLYDHAPRMTRDDAPGAYAWPSAALGRWPTALSRQCGLTLMLAMLRLLLSQPESWWTKGDDTWTWVIYTLQLAAQDRTGDPKVAEEAAAYALLLLDTLSETGVSDVTGPVNESLDADDVRDQMIAIVGADSLPYSQHMVGRIDTWTNRAVRERAGAPRHDSEVLDHN